MSPPCVAATHLQRRYRHCSEDCRPACWSTPLRLRFRNARGLRQPLLFRARLAAGGIATFTMYKRTRTKSGGCEPTVGVVTRLQRNSLAYGRQSLRH